MFVTNKVKDILNNYWVYKHAHPVEIFGGFGFPVLMYSKKPIQRSFSKIFTMSNDEYRKYTYPEGQDYSFDAKEAYYSV